MNTVQQSASQSTCQKRVTVCVILDANGATIACESNRCAPANGVCSRLGVTNTKADYPSESQCNWTHAERRAVAALPHGAAPHRAVLYGHDFYCDDCEAALKAVGVTVFSLGGAA